MVWKWKRRDWAAVSSELFNSHFVPKIFPCLSLLFQKGDHFEPKLRYQMVLKVFYLQPYKNAVTPVQLHASFQSHKQSKWIQYLDHRSAELDLDFKYTNMERRCVWYFPLAKIRTGPRLRFFRPCLCSSQAIEFSSSYIALLLAIWTVRSCPVLSPKEC